MSLYFQRWAQTTSTVPGAALVPNWGDRQNGTGKAVTRWAFTWKRKRLSCCNVESTEFHSDEKAFEKQSYTRVNIGFCWSSWQSMACSFDQNRIQQWDGISHFAFYSGEYFVSVAVTWYHNKLRRFSYRKLIRWACADNFWYFTFCTSKLWGPKFGGSTDEPTLHRHAAKCGQFGCACVKSLALPQTFRMNTLVIQFMLGIMLVTYTRNNAKPL